MAHNDFRLQSVAMISTTSRSRAATVVPPRRGTLSVFLLVFLLAAGGVAKQPDVVSGQIKDRYWQLGVGYFYTGLGSLTELDVAQFDWLVLCFGSIPADRETTEQLNRFLKISTRS